MTPPTSWEDTREATDRSDAHHYYISAGGQQMPRTAPGTLAEHASDDELVSRTRTGDTDAFAVLWHRHHRVARSAARASTTTFDADDLVAEAFANVYHAILRGGGPRSAFRSYLLTAVRNTAAGWGRIQRPLPITNTERVEDPRFSDESKQAAHDHSLVVDTFNSLPERWRQALWYSEVDGLTAKQIARLLGMTANAVAALTYRAREGLRSAWVQNPDTEQTPLSPQMRAARLVADTEE
jgi:RNA polymerase sigma factor (sigma-70 family)